MEHLRLQGTFGSTMRLLFVVSGSLTLILPSPTASQSGWATTVTYYILSGADTCTINPSDFTAKCSDNSTFIRARFRKNQIRYLHGEHKDHEDRCSLRSFRVDQAHGNGPSACLKQRHFDAYSVCRTFDACRTCRHISRNLRAPGR